MFNRKVGQEALDQGSACPSPNSAGGSGCLETAPAPRESAIGALAARMRQHHDAVEAATLEQQRIAKSERDTAARNRYKEEELIAMVDEIVEEINRHLAETKIVTATAADGKNTALVGGPYVSGSFIVASCLQILLFLAG